MNQRCKFLRFKQCWKHKLKALPITFSGTYTHKKWKDSVRTEGVFPSLVSLHLRSHFIRDKHARMAARRNTKQHQQAFSRCFPIPSSPEAAPAREVQAKPQATGPTSNDNSIQDKHEDKQLSTLLPLGAPSPTQLPAFNNRAPSG